MFQNLPSGELGPSLADIEISQKLNEAGGINEYPGIGPYHCRRGVVLQHERTRVGVRRVKDLNC